MIFIDFGPFGMDVRSCVLLFGITCPRFGVNLGLMWEGLGLIRGRFGIRFGIDLCLIWGWLGID